ncbi:MAG: hypothetical protein A3G34_07975 [Candidatus Lindowbacteria bacterium RIFCSPLOWO2_12_FULL_62_27]|nr:MAG: hypothetical protein A3G34_07975 [Candidatus Lindowbacteria bacterium RIFCSPLOWO2_12_FULL_62_27]OGH63593.1 MAG: hypothetical protein A3I06_14000 [Candidatus Lindowbacteria bacterium RIFCSPLOWO2_02_FULL_62_12]
MSDDASDDEKIINIDADPVNKNWLRIVARMRRRKMKERDEEFERRRWTIAAMHKYGGGFVRRLAELASCADLVELGKIKATWSKEWDEYELVGKQMEERGESPKW